MNSKCGSSIFPLLFILLIPNILHGQDEKVKFDITPHIKGLTNLKNGYLELGPMIYNSKIEFIPYVKVPVTDEASSIVQIDKGTTSLSSGISFSYILDFTGENTPMKHLYMTGQVEAGTKQYRYFPDSTTLSEHKEYESSISGDLKIGYYMSKGEEYTNQWGPELRIRYARDVQAAEEVGVVTDNPNGISTVQKLVVSNPTIRPTFSPAFAISFYKGKSQLSYTPVFYYYFTGNHGESNPFNNVSRLRIETWVYYYPKITGKVVKIGLSPFFTARTSGDDSLDKFQYGMLVQLLVGKNFLNFF
jgi:hypothetical protein